MRSLWIFFSVCFISQAWGYTGYNICNFGKETVDNIICYGPAVLKETIVTGNIKVAGSLKASQISASGMEIAGSIDIDGSTIKGMVTGVGQLVASDVHFGDTLRVDADHVQLTHSAVKGSLVVHSDNATPYVEMLCQTQVLGEVVFEGKPGVIQITDDSYIKGKIVNGSMEFVKKTC